MKNKQPQIKEIKNKTEEVQIKKKIEIKELKEGSELEEEIEDFDDDISEESSGRRFHFNSPSLQRINISPTTVVNLEKDLENVPVSSSSEGDSFSYSAGVGNKDEPKYVNSSVNVLEGVNKMDMREIGKREERREVTFGQSSESMSERVGFEKYEKVKRADTENMGRNEERREIKYEPPR